MAKLEKEIKEDMKKMKNLTVQVVPSELIENFKTSVESFGCVNIMEDEFPYTLSVGSLIQRVNFHSGIKILYTIKAAERGETSAIFIADFLFITSYANSTVAKYSLDGKFVESLAVENYPRDIAQVDQTEAIISIYGKNKLLFVDIAEMKLLRTLDLPGISVSGICCFEGNTYIVTCGSPMTWVNSSGKNVKQKSTGGDSFYVTTSDLKDYVYGDAINSVSYVAGETTKFTYTNVNLKGPRGIGIDCEGNIYIAGYSSKNIHQITNDGKLIRVIPIKTFGIKSPWTIRFTLESNKFVVTCNASGNVVLCEIN
ncbi:unnamed protein product [Mytilus coruscus]|uniref:SMP-30/Gluconolactonase/LRE-like region domain-containing protein n=1 Tax=Mytilus coruscus TaxID=42192 RepID=A0A6J8DJ57_MYTCO|nr:unnamed protein product [Mytilus coruscus]